MKSPAFYETNERRKKKDKKQVFPIEEGLLEKRMNF